MTQLEFAALAGASKNSQLMWEKEGTFPNAKTLAVWAEHGADVAYIVTGNRSSASQTLSVQKSEPPDLQAQDFVHVPRYDVKASAGHGAVVNDESIVDSLAFKRDWIVRALGLDPARLALIDVAGDSMTPTISDGDLILLDTRPMTHRAEGIYVISHDNALLVKRLRVRLNGDVEIISDNPRYGSETITGEQLTRLRIVGRVVWQGRRV